MADLNAEEECVRAKKGFKLFGKDIAEITCFRNSFISGICAGVTGGLITFMMTSKPLVSSHIAFASLWIGVFAYWIPCRYNYENNMLISLEWKKSHKLMMQSKQVSENELADNSSEEQK